MKVIRYTVVSFFASIVLLSNCKEDSQAIHTKQLEIKALKEGKINFQQYCSACHSKNLAQDLSGPALGHINEFRSKKWLLNFTKYPQKMMSHHDKFAVCTWNKWKPSIKSGYPKMIYGENIPDISQGQMDSQIINIYKWIKNESTKQNINIDNLRTKFDCKETILQTKNTLNWYLYQSEFCGLEKLESKSNGNRIPRPKIQFIDGLNEYEEVRFYLVFPKDTVALGFTNCENYFVPIGSHGEQSISIRNDTKGKLVSSLWVPGKGYVSFVKDWNHSDTEINVSYSDYNLSFEKYSKYQYE